MAGAKRLAFEPGFTNPSLGFVVSFANAKDATKRTISSKPKKRSPFI
jgi:hypothetical protein